MGASAVVRLALLLLGVVAAGANCSSPIIAGTIEVEGVTGDATSAFVAVSGGVGSPPRVRVVDARALALAHGARAYVATRCAQAFSPLPAQFFRPFTPLGSRVEFTVDLSAVGCGCNVGVYLASLPAATPTRCGDYYCDANAVCGALCPEIDLMEANQFALAVTPHACQPSAPPYSKCDGAGCALRTHTLPFAAFGPGAHFTIDTRQPFSVTAHFVAGGESVFAALRTVVAQPARGRGRELVLEHNASLCGRGYLESLSGALARGMALVASFWGSSGEEMRWLDVPPCNVSAACAAPARPVVVVGDFRAAAGG